MVPFMMSSLCSLLILTQAKCSKFPHFEQTRTADLLLGLRPVKLHPFDTHFASVNSPAMLLFLTPFTSLLHVETKPGAQ